MPKPETWEDNPVFLEMPSGLLMPFFMRTHLAKALNRSLVTIRKMERDRVLCHPRIKHPRGWYLYTRDQIDDLIRLADEEGVLDPTPRNKFSRRFIRESHAIIRRIPKG